MQILEIKHKYAEVLANTIKEDIGIDMKIYESEKGMVLITDQVITEKIQKKIDNSIKYFQTGILCRDAELIF